MKKFKGTGVALITPFKADQKVDHAALERHIQHCISGGVEYLVVMGTTAENPTLTPDEKHQVLRTAVKAADGQVPIVYGIGGNNTSALIDQLQNNDLSGVAGILSVSPYYNKPTQEGIYQHYKALSEATSLPIILYNVPGRTGSNITAETTLRLARDCENIVGVKEASGDMEQVMQIIQDRPEGFLVISGEDNLTLPMIACGGDGVISVSGQAYPAVFTDMVRDALAGNMAAARDGHYRLFEATKLLFAEGNPGGVKAALEAQGICEGHLRLPLWPVSDALKKKISAITLEITG